VATLNQDMTDNTMEFLSNPTKGALLLGNTLTISAIFSFFREDFNNQTGKPNKTTSESIHAFLVTYANSTIQDFIRKNPTTQFVYFPYNWNLNGPTSGLCSVNRLCFPWWMMIVACIVLIFIIGTTTTCIRLSANGYQQVMTN